jgi:hypothetical protein
MPDMKPQVAKTEFLKYLQRAGVTLKKLTPAAGIEAMLRYYENERPVGCDPAADGDMLLFQWGTNDWGNGPAFEINITRQLMVTDDDEEPHQLALTFHFDAAVAPKGLKDGNKWCASPGGLAAFRHFVTGSKAFRAVANETADKVDLRFGRT